MPAPDSTRAAPLTDGGCARRQAMAERLSHLAITPAPLQSILDKTVAWLADAVDLDFASVLELDPDGCTLTLRAGVGWREGMVGRARVSTGVTTHAGFALAVSEPVVVTDLAEEGRFPGSTLLRDHGVRSGVATVIPGHPRTFGVVAAHSLRPRGFDVTEVQFLRTVAGIVAASVKLRSAEQALSDSEVRMRAILDTLVDGIVTIDERGTVQSANPATERMFGYSAEELLGSNVALLMPEPFRSEHDGYVAGYVGGGRPRVIGTGREVVGRRKSGDVFPMDLAVSEIRLWSRRMFTGILRDITERRRLEREILSAAVEEQRRIGQDLHDGVCQQIAAIAFATEVVRRKLAARAAPEAGAVAQLCELVDQAMSQARELAHGLQPVTLEADGLATALGDLAAKTGERFGTRCTCVCDAGTLLHDNAVATHLYRIAQEAVANAVRHGRAGTIAIGLAVSRADEIVLTVADDGVGLWQAPADADGIGIPAMKYRARVIGGTLTIEPGRSGRGTSVRCAVRGTSRTGNTGGDELCAASQSIRNGPLRSGS